MATLLVTLHVVVAIFLVGPLAMIPMTALRSIRRRDADAVQGAARQTLIYGLGSIAVFLLGIGIVPFEPGYNLGTPWLTISMTLYLIALVLVLAVLAPSLRKAARLIEQGVPATRELTAPAPAAGESTPEGAEAADVEPAGAGTTPAVTASATELASKERLDSLYGRSAGAAGLVALLFVVIAVLMVTKPFS